MIEFPISEKQHVSRIKRQITELAKTIGFSESAIGEIAICVTELAENLIQHGAINGKIIYGEINEAKKRGIKIISEDEGPGITDIESVIEDGYSTTGSLGIGLGAVKRMMNEFSIISKQLPYFKTGTRIITKKYIPNEPKSIAFKKPTVFSVFSRSKLGESVNGDNYFLQHFDNSTLFAVIDGLGHGAGASEASKMTRAFLYENYKVALEDIIPELHKALRHTRGVAISIALINNDEKTLHYIGVGNVLGRVYNSPEPINLVNYNGTLGLSLRKFKLFTYPWHMENIIILTSDGISYRYNFKNKEGLLQKHPILIADYIIKRFSKNYDDATILVGGPG